MAGTGGATGRFSSGPGFVMAAAGSAVGLGNIWKFPYITGEYGGGAFVLFYLLCILVLGVPVMLAEIHIGRTGRRGPVDSFRKLGSAAAARCAPAGYLFIATAFVVLSFYAVIGGWAAWYMGLAIANRFEGMSLGSATATFDALMQAPGTMILCQLLFMGVTVSVVARGVSGGIERVSNILMPGFLLLLLGLMLYALLATDAGARSIAFMFRPDFSRLTPAAMAEALGHAFFSLGLGLGAMLVYGQYMPGHPRASSPVRVVAAVVILDTLVALAAGLMIFAIIFHAGGTPAGGPGLLFTSLPVALGALSGGQAVGIFWFAAVTVAALTSGIATLEVAVAHLVQRGHSRARAAVVTGALITLAGFGSVWSLGAGSDVTILAGRNLFETLNFLTSSIALPLGGLVIVLVVGWMVRPEEYRASLPGIGRTGFALLMGLTRFVAPILVMVVLVTLILGG